MTLKSTVERLLADFHDDHNWALWAERELRAALKEDEPIPFNPTSNGPLITPLDLALIERVLLAAAKHTPFTTTEWDELQAALDAVNEARRGS